MRIYIIGLPGSGKTSLATTLATQNHIDHIELDDLYHQYDGQRRHRRHFEDFEAQLLQKLQHTDSWVVEGVYPIAEISSIADKVILLKLPLYRCIYRQWKRYATDPMQRSNARYGTMTNLGLSLMAIGLALDIWGIKVYKNQPRVTYRQFLNSVVPDKILKTSDAKLFATQN